MKRVRLDTWVCHLQPPRNPRLPQRRSFSQTTTRSTRALITPIRHQWCQRTHDATGKRHASSQAVVVDGEAIDSEEPLEEKRKKKRRPTNPLPLHQRRLEAKANLRIAKLSALHARLSLPVSMPLQTLQRCLIDKSADAHPARNNASLAILGQDLIAYYTAEHLIVNFPRLPLPIVFAAQYAYNGPEVLERMRNEWGVELAAAPGHEVDKALLQFKRMVAGKALAADGASQVQDSIKKQDNPMGASRWRMMRGSNPVIHDDEFGATKLDTKPYAGATISKSAKQAQAEAASRAFDEDADENETPEEETTEVSTNETGGIAPVTATTASATFIRALAGAVYLHAGDEAIKQFHQDHILSRHLHLHKLFHFDHPARDLNRLCQREGFEPPIARLLSETGRASRTPVFVVGVYSGEDKLGEAAGASLNEARVRAAAAALRAWYLYSPPVDNIMRPSSMETPETAPKRWLPQLVDPGEIVT